MKKTLIVLPFILLGLLAYVAYSYSMIFEDKREYWLRLQKYLQEQSMKEKLLRNWEKIYDKSARVYFSLPGGKKPLLYPEKYFLKFFRITRKSLSIVELQKLLHDPDNTEIESSIRLQLIRLYLEENQLRKAENELFKYSKLSKSYITPEGIPENLQYYTLKLKFAGKHKTGGDILFKIEKDVLGELLFLHKVMPKSIANFVPGMLEILSPPNHKHVQNIEKIVHQIYKKNKDYCLTDDWFYFKKENSFYGIPIILKNGNYFLKNVAKEKFIVTRDKLKLQGRIYIRIFNDLFFAFESRPEEVKIDFETGEIQGKLVLVFLVILFFLALWMFYSTNKLNEESEKKEAAFDYLSHELKTPVSGIIVLIESLLHRNVETKESQDYLFRILNKALHLSEMLENLLYLTRLRQGNFLQDSGETRVNPYLLCTEVQKKNPELQTLNIKDETGGEIILCQQQVLEIILKNVLKNAVQAGENSNIWVKLDLERNFKTLSLKDDGPGIDMQKHPLLGEKFYSTKKSTGLGLHLIAEIMKQLGGHSSFKTTPGKGFCLLLSFPK
ncbi:sensor histidine kinase [Candidatus Riflebacteria bacterium]